MSTATAAVKVGFHEVPLNALAPSSLNPRKSVGDVSDLAASIREVGILEPILVRPRETGDTPETSEAYYEVVAGSRRHAAAIQAGLMLVPVLVRELTDTQALELAIVENNQRGDIHPLEEADAFVKLRTFDRAYTPEVIATKIGRPVAYVKNRLRLLDLGDEAREAFLDNDITIGHAERLARLAPDVQVRALQACYMPLYSDDGAMGLAAISKLDDWITDNVVLDVTSPQVQEQLPALAETVARAEAEGATLVQLSTSHYASHGIKGKAAPLPPQAWLEVKDKACVHVTQGVVVYGSNKRAELLTVCLKSSKCPKHWPAPKEAKAGKAGKRPAWEVEQEKREAERKVWNTQQPLVLRDICAALAGRTIGVDYFDATCSSKGDREFIAEAIGEVTEANLGQALWMLEVLRCSLWDAKHFAQQIQELVGFDVDAWRAAHAPEPVVEEPAPAASKKTGGKKAAKTR